MAYSSNPIASNNGPTSAALMAPSPYNSPSLGFDSPTTATAPVNNTLIGGGVDIVGQTQQQQQQQQQQQYQPPPPPYAAEMPAPPNSGAGAAQEYYSSFSNDTSPQPSPGPTAVSFPAGVHAGGPPTAAAAGSRNSQVPIHNPYSMSATYMPGQL